VPIENPALQAVLMALEMRNAIGALTEKWRQLGHEIGFGIGIAHGYATLGTIGFEGRFDYAAIGTVSNVASRLCDEAKPGQILIHPRVLMAVKDTVAVESVGEFELKGIRLSNSCLQRASRLSANALSLAGEQHPMPGDAHFLPCSRTALRRERESRGGECTGGFRGRHHATGCRENRQARSPC